MPTSTLTRRISALPSWLWVSLLTSACLVPFLNKAVHIDDTLFLRVAQHIQAHPADFYGFQMNWFGYSQPMVENFDNPPLACYYLALVTAIGGWSDPVLHLALLLPALLAAWGTYSLATRLCSHPLLATAVAVLTPLFVVSATTLMCDVMLLALWVWAVVWFERGIQEGGRSAFFLSGLLVGLAFWTKFTALALVPLLAAYGLCQRRRPGWWLLAAGLPLLFALGYELTAFLLYRKSLLFTAAGAAANVAHPGSVWERQVLGLSFLGGCFLPLLLFIPRLWSLRNLLVGFCLVTPCLILYPYLGRYALLWSPSGQPHWLLVAQSALFIIGGLHVLLLSAADFWNQRDARGMLLVLWVLGVYVFATGVNWTVNSRSLLPMLPAVAILLVRRVEWIARAPKGSLRASGAWATCWPLLPAAALSLVVTKADYDLAGAGRAAAAKICTQYQRSSKTLWFEGHWGFQYYMEKHGARALEWPFLLAQPGDIVVIPLEAVNTYDIPNNLVRPVELLTLRPNRHCATMSLSAGAGFYTSGAGPFPYSVGSIDPERYYVFEVTQSLEMAVKAPGGVSPIGALQQQITHLQPTLAESRTRSTVN